MTSSELLEAFAQEFKQNAGIAAATLTLATAIVRVSWSITAASIRWVSFKLSARVRHCQIILGPFDGANQLVREMKCLIVRYGNDQYLTTVASEQERWEGRLQNRVIKIRKKKKADALIGEFSLPVHKRLGTQFVCAIDANNTDDAKMLEEKKELWNFDAGSENEKVPPRREGKRVFVLLNDPSKHSSLKLARVPDIDTPDGRPVYNNMYYPF